MEQNPTPAAPAQPDAPAPTISATRDAANKGDFTAFDNAHLAGRRGAPLAEVPAPLPQPEPEPPPQPLATEPAKAEEARQVSKRQQQINDYERRIAEQNERIARLEARHVPAAPRSEQMPAAPAPQADPEPDPDDTTRYPEGQFDRKYYKDQARWEARQLLTAELANRDRTAAVQSHEQHISQQVDARLHAAQAKGIDVPALLNAKLPIDASMPGFGTISGVVVRSDLQVELMQHFVANPDETIRIAQMPPGAAFREICILEGKLSARLDAAPESTPAAPAPSTITAAPPPPPTLSRPTSTGDPKASALSRGDFDAFNRIELAERAAKRSR